MLFRSEKAKVVIPMKKMDGTGNIYNALIDKGSFRNHPVWASSSGPLLRHIHVHVGGFFPFMVPSLSLW